MVAKVFLIFFANQLIPFLQKKVWKGYLKRTNFVYPQSKQFEGLNREIEQSNS